MISTVHPPLALKRKYPSVLRRLDPYTPKQAHARGHPSIALMRPICLLTQDAARYANLNTEPKSQALNPKTPNLTP